MRSPYSHPLPGEDDRPLGRWEDARLDEIERVRIEAGGGCLADLAEMTYASAAA